MWPLARMRELGVRFAPHENSFTYTFPPPYFTKRRASLRAPHTYSGGSLTGSVSLYLHIPFCEMDCSSCSLHRTAQHQRPTIARYVEALKRELHLVGEHNLDVTLDSVYVGGGTPTICSAVELGELLDTVGEVFRLPSAPIEVSLECAPTTKRDYRQWRSYLSILVRREKLAVNRLSFGLQASDSLTLRDMGRTGGQSAAQALLFAADDTCNNYNADFLLNYPSPKSTAGVNWVGGLLAWIDTKRATGLRLPSLSLYQLWDVPTIRITHAKYRYSIEEAEVLARKWKLQNSLFERQFTPGIISTIVQEQRHVSRFFRNRHLSFRHIGCGSGAYSIFPTEFIHRPRDIEQYMHACERRDVLNSMSYCYTLTPEEVEIRRLIMGLRSCDWTSTGGPISQHSFHEGLITETRERIESLATLGLIEKKRGAYRLADSAFLIGNEIATYLHPQSHSRREVRNDS